MTRASQYSLPLCTAIQVALVNHLKKFDITPNAVIGHSSGEATGAYAAKAITAAKAVAKSYYKGLVSTKVTRQGGMAAIGLNPREISVYLHDGVVVACHNSPDNVTISGVLDALNQTLKEIATKVPGTFIRKLYVNIAYQSSRNYSETSIELLLKGFFA